MIAGLQTQIAAVAGTCCGRGTIEFSSKVVTVPVANKDIGSVDLALHELTRQSKLRADVGVADGRSKTTVTVWEKEHRAPRINYGVLRILD